MSNYLQPVPSVAEAIEELTFQLGAESVLKQLDDFWELALESDIMGQYTGRHRAIMHLAYKLMRKLLLAIGHEAHMGKALA